MLELQRYHFLCYVSRSALSLGMLEIQTISYAAFRGPPFGGSFLMLRFVVRPVILDMLEILRAVHFEVRPFIRYIRNTEDGPFLMLRFEVRPVILDMLEIQRADHLLCYVSRSALPLCMVEIQRWDHF